MCAYGLMIMIMIVSKRERRHGGRRNYRAEHYIQLVYRVLSVPERNTVERG